MFAKSSALSSSAPVFAPQASLESQEYQNTCYGYGEQFYQNNGYGNGEYYQVNCYGAQVQANMSPYYMIGGNGYTNTNSGSFTSTYCKESALNLDDFSDLSDSDSDDDAPKVSAKLIISEVTELPESVEPAEEPSPCATSGLTQSNFEDETVSVVSLSSASSEPEGEEVDTADKFSDEMDSDTVYDIRRLLTFREALQHQEPLKLYRTMAVKQEEPPSPQPQPKADAGSRGRTKSKLDVSENSWAAQRRRVKSEAIDATEQVARSIKSILNKLTLEKFASLAQQLLDCGICNSDHVEILIHEVFGKATSQHHFIDMYADLCVLLHEHFLTEPFEDCKEGSKKLTFKRLLLDECQSSFERLLSPPAGLDDLEPEARTIAEVRYKTHMLGNIKLVGGLLSRGMLASKVGIAILEELLSNPTAEALESAAALLTAMGPTADRPDWPQKVALNAIFERIALIVKMSKCQPRERCLLKDLLELRANAWVDKRPKKMERAMTLAQVAQSAAGKEVKPKAMRMVAPAFDQEKFRDAAQRALRELRFSKDDAEAARRIGAQGVPREAAKQAAELAEVLANVVQEGAAVRESGFKMLLAVAAGAGWQPQALDEAVQLFVSEMAPDLSCDVPNLEQILAKDFHALLRASRSFAPALRALKEFKA
ncbi:unnamed protein product [Effrenium voratum]|nr:unnamed protein product [Effrenium voratum]